MVRGFSIPIEQSMMTMRSNDEYTHAINVDYNSAKKLDSRTLKLFVNIYLRHAYLHMHSL